MSNPKETALVIFRSLAPPVGVLLLFAAACDPGESHGAVLEAKLRASNDVTAKVTYEGKIQGQAETITLLGTIAQRPPDRRMDVSSGTETEESFLRYKGELIECTEGKCRRATDNSRSLALDRLSFLDYSLDFGDTLMGQIVAGARVELLPEQAVVGLDADCFRAESAESTPQPQAAVEVCFSSEEGILLSMHSQLTDPDLTFSIQAISVEHEVSDDDLSPPAPVEESSPAPASNR